VHVPFCQAWCRYCDFYSNVLDSRAAQRFVTAALAELDAAAKAADRPLSSIYVGGGTPTCLGAALLERLLRPLGELADANTEFSIEANPNTVNRLLAELLLGMGVNRVSLGVQSFVDGELAVLGRSHSSLQAQQAATVLQNAGLGNLSLDLIYGIPGQTLRTWRESLRRAIDLGAGHLSCYALSFEPDTPLERDLAQGKLAQMDESLQKECYLAAQEECRLAGLEHYEISNFARPGRRCRHNLTYWRNEPYLGIGPAAASYLDDVRRTNLPDLDAYIGALHGGVPAPCTSETLDLRHRMAETLMLGLRLLEGVDRGAFAERFGVDPLKAFPGSISRYQAQGALVVDSTCLRLSPGVLFAADTVLADIVAEA